MNLGELISALQHVAKTHPSNTPVVIESVDNPLITADANFLDYKTQVLQESQRQVIVISTK
jgi:hypothetical protein